MRVTFADRETAELTVSDVAFEPWTWAVTGVTYDDAVTVKFVQPYTVDGDVTDVAGEVHLVPFGDEWGWFFGASRAFVDEQVALYGDDGSATMFSLSQESDEARRLPRDPLPRPAARAYRHVLGRHDSRKPDASTIHRNGVIAFDEPIVTACGRADPDGKRRSTVSSTRRSTTRLSFGPSSRTRSAISPG